MSDPEMIADDASQRLAGMVDMLVGLARAWGYPVYEDDVRVLSGVRDPKQLVRCAAFALNHRGGFAWSIRAVIASEDDDAAQAKDT